MYSNFVPTNLHNQAEALISDLKLLSDKPTECPYCKNTKLYFVNTSSGYCRCSVCKRGFNRSLNTPFYRLAPLELLPIIAGRRLCGQGYATIRHELNTYTPWVIKRRVRVIEQYMQTHYPELYQWYQPFIEGTQQSIPDNVVQQIQQLKSWVTGILNATTSTCPHCDSIHCQKMNDTRRAQFRCKSCWRYFSNLKGTGLEHLGYSENWLTMIDLLADGKNNHEIEQVLKISTGTVTKARRIWLDIMQRQNLLILKEWISSR